MSTSDSTIKGKFNEVVGGVKQSVGEAIGNEKLANQGVADQVKGNAQQAWGAVKEGFKDATQERQEQGQVEAHDVREKITSTAQNVKEHVQSAVDSFREKKAS